MAEMCSEFDQAFHDLQEQWPTLNTQQQRGNLANFVSVLLLRFLSTHPFVNGNGRIARLWAVLLNARFGIELQLPVIDQPGAEFATAIDAAWSDDDPKIIASYLEPRMIVAGGSDA